MPITALLFIPDSAAQANTSITDETYLHFDGAMLKWWLGLLHRNFGFIGVIILRLMYGSNDAFDNDIVDSIKTKHTIKQHEINAGISSLWEKDRVKEVK